MWAILLVGTLLSGTLGCATTPPPVDPSMRTADSYAQLVRIAKRDFQICIGAFYREDWKQVVYIADAMEVVGQRWQQIPPEKAKAQAFSDTIDRYKKQVADLKTAATDKNVDQTTKLLRELAKTISDLAELQPPIEIPEASKPVEDKKIP